MYLVFIHCDCSNIHVSRGFLRLTDDHSHPEGNGVPANLLVNASDSIYLTQQRLTPAAPTTSWRDVTVNPMNLVSGTVMFCILVTHSGMNEKVHDLHLSMCQASNKRL